MKAPDWRAGVVGQGSILNVPDGPAWAAVLRLVNRNLAAFADNERTLLVSLIEDAVRGVSWWGPDLEGAEDVAGIAHWLLGRLRECGRSEPRKRVLKVIAMIPKADPVSFEAALRGHIEEGKHRDVLAEDFRELLYAGMFGMPAARDLPDVVISVGADYLLASEEDIEDQRRYGRSSDEIDLYFGIKEGLRHVSFPASALRGPWGHLLRYHTGKALDFYIEVFNHSAEWYAHPRLRDPLEKAWEADLTFADGTTHKQWTNGRLWGVYRGISVGPYPLESMLMALETWLLQVGKHNPEALDGILVDILRRSDNAALAAVVASVAIAYPHAAGEALLVLLSVRDYITIDRSRLVGEQQVAMMTGIFPTLRADDQVYEMERKQANALPHRKHDLEAAIAILQLGPLAPRVHVLLDKHLAALPPKEQQDEDDLLWRLAIHRMDLRQYAVSETPGPEEADQDVKPGEPPRQYVRLDPKPPEADVQAMVDESALRLANVSVRLGLLMWGLQAFKRDTGKYDPSQWAAKLAEAQTMDREAGQEDGSYPAPGLVAAVCIRDRWEDMVLEQRHWCVDTVCAEVMRHADDIGDMERVQNNPMAADRACAFVLPLLLSRPLDAPRMDRVKTALAAALTHPVEQVRWYATWSIDENVWATDRALALHCINAIAAEAAIIAKAQREDKARPYDERQNPAEIMAAAAANIRSRFWKDGAIVEDAHVTLDLPDRFRADALNRMLVILGHVPHDPLAIAAFTRASRMLVGWWTSDDDQRRRGSRNFQAEHDVSSRIQEFLLRTSPEAGEQVLTPLLAAIDRHSRELQSVMQGLTNLQDTDPNTPQYWFLWGLIADAVRRAKWVSRLSEDRHSDGGDLLSAVFLTAYWKDNLRHWRFLDGYAHLVDALFEALPPTSVVLDYYARFLYHIGERSLPDAFVRVAASLRSSDPQKMLAKSDTVFTLEVLLQRFVYGRPLELKRDERIRNAVLFILDCLVESGSSAAFRMRDDFVTPAA